MIVDGDGDKQDMSGGESKELLRLFLPLFKKKNQIDEKKLIIFLSSPLF